MRLVLLVCVLLSANFQAHCQYQNKYPKVDSLIEQGQWQEAIRVLIDNQHKTNLQPQFSEENIIRHAHCLYKLGLFDSARQVLNHQEFEHALPQVFKSQMLGDLTMVDGTGIEQALTHYNSAFEKAQTENLPLLNQIEILISLSETHLSQRNTSEARQYLPQLYDKLNAAPNSRINKAVYYRLMGKLFRFEQRPDSALFYYHKSKGLLNQPEATKAAESRALSDLFEGLASLYADLAQLDSQLYYGAAQLAVLEHDPTINQAQLAKAYAQSAFDLQLTGRIEEAEAHLEKAIDIYLGLNELENVGLASAYILKASMITYQYKEYHRAIELLKEAIRIFQKNFGPDHRELARPYQELGKTYNLMNEGEKAIGHTKKALEISLRNKDYERTYRAHFFLGESLVGMSRYSEAREHFEQAIAMVKQQYGPDNIANAYLNTGLAFSAAGLGQTQKAKNYFSEAGKVLIQNYGPIGPHVAQHYLHLGDFHRQLGQLEKAMQYYKKTVFSNKSPVQGGGAQVADFSMNIEARNSHADVLMEQFTSQEDWHLLEIINDLHYENLESLKFLIDRTNPGADLSGFSDQYRNTYDQLIAIAHILYQSNQSDKLKKTLFSMSENARSVLLALRTNELAMAQKVNSDLSRSRLADKISYFRGLIEAEEPNSEETQSLSRELIALNAEWESRRNNDAQNKDSLTWIAPTELSAIQQGLDEDQKIVEYQKLEGGFLVFVVGKSSYDLVKLTIDEAELAKLLEAFQDALEKDRPSDFSSAAHGLYQQLFEPVEAYLHNQRIILVPDGLLWKVPFDLLTSKYNKDITSFKKLDYLIKTYSIAHAYSAKLVLNKQQSQQAENALLAFSYDPKTKAAPKLATMRNAELANLPGTALEIAKIDRIIKTDAFYGTRASETNFKKLAPNYQVLHLAMHALVDSSNHEKAWLRFIKNPKSDDDSRLDTYELQNLRLQADLVVLSACNSGQGKLYRGEGIAGLGSAFIFAGAKSVLLSKWDVSDGTSPEIMASFYGNLQQGMSKDRALQKAKLSFLETSNNLSANPLYWGSFYLVGDPAPLTLQKAFIFDYGWLALIAATLLVAILVMKKIRR